VQPSRTEVAATGFTLERTTMDPERTTVAATKFAIETTRMRWERTDVPATGSALERTKYLTTDEMSLAKKSDVVNVCNILRDLSNSVVLQDNKEDVSSEDGNGKGRKRKLRKTEKR
jgi:hypothetical protein